VLCTDLFFCGKFVGLFCSELIILNNGSYANCIL